MSLRSSKQLVSRFGFLLLPGLMACTDHKRDSASMDDASVSADSGGGEVDSEVTGGDANGGDGDAGHDSGAPDAELPEPTPTPDREATVPVGLLGRAYAETSFRVQSPASLARAFDALAITAGETRLFVNVFTQGEAGVMVRYGAADADGVGSVRFQDPAFQRDFAIAPSREDPAVLVSDPFTYVLSANTASPLGGAGKYRLGLTAMEAVWSARPDASLQTLSEGRLRGVITRTEAETRKLSLGALCPLVCGLTSSACAGQGVTHLAGLFDCTDTKPDTDLDGDGVADGYRLVIAFESEQTALTPDPSTP